MILVIDQLHENEAICEDFSANEFTIPRELIEQKANEGDIIRFLGKVWVVDKELTNIRSQYIQQLMSQVFVD